MMTVISLDEAQTQLSDLVHSLTPGEEVIITEKGKEVARLSVATRGSKRVLGGLAGTVLYMAPDFDEPVDEMREYM